MTQNDIPQRVACPERFDEVIAAFEHALYGDGMAEASVKSYASAMRVFDRRRPPFKLGTTRRRTAP